MRSEQFAYQFLFHIPITQPHSSELYCAYMDYRKLCIGLLQRNALHEIKLAENPAASRSRNTLHHALDANPWLALGAHTRTFIFNFFRKRITQEQLSERISLRAKLAAGYSNPNHTIYATLKTHLSGVHLHAPFSWADLRRVSPAAYASINTIKTTLVTDYMDVTPMRVSTRDEIAGIIAKFIKEHIVPACAIVIESDTGSQATEYVLFAGYAPPRGVARRGQQNSDDEAYTEACTPH